jgi:probable HAF family extracellular repeat protein
MQVPLFGTATIIGGYTAIDLEIGTDSEAWKVNNAGQVIGSNSDPAYRYFFWEAGSAIQLPIYPQMFNEAGQVLGNTRDGAVLWSKESTTVIPGVAGYALNDLGQLVARGPSGAFRWDDGEIVPIVGTMVTAGAINNSGHVAGTSVFSGRSHAFFWDGTMHDLGTLGGSYSHGTGINDAGHVTGWSRTAAGEFRAFFWDGTMHDLGTLGGGHSSTRGEGESGSSPINDYDQVIGHSRTAAGEVHAFLWDGTMRDLGTLGGDGSTAMALSNSGEVVGFAMTVAGEYHAVVWKNGSIIDLDPGYGSSWATDINDEGVIVGGSLSETGLYHSYMWVRLTPVEQLQICADLALDLEAQGVLNKGQAHSLVNKINLATAMLNDGKNTPAINLLEAFQNQVNGANLTPEQGEELIACVQVVIDAMGS